MRDCGETWKFYIFLQMVQQFSFLIIVSKQYFSGWELFKQYPNFCLSDTTSDSYSCLSLMVTYFCTFLFCLFFATVWEVYSIPVSFISMFSVFDLASFTACEDWGWGGDVPRYEWVRACGCFNWLCSVMDRQTVTLVSTWEIAVQFAEAVIVHILVSALSGRC